MPLAFDTPADTEEPTLETRLAHARRILLVDDNEDAAEMLSLLLTQLGRTVRIANDGMAALALAAAFEPDVAVLDLERAPPQQALRTPSSSQSTSRISRLR